MFYGDLSMKKYLINYIYENKNKIRILSFIILIGIFVGILFFNILYPDLKNDILNDFTNTLNLSKQDNFQMINIILNSIFLNIISIIIIYLISLFIIAPYMTTLFSFIKGVSIGFYIASIIKVFGIGNGTICILTVILVPNIIYFPVLIYMLINSINFHYNIFEKKINLSLFIKEVYYIIISVSLILVSIMLEQAMCNIMVNIWKNIL